MISPPVGLRCKFTQTTTACPTEGINETVNTVFDELYLSLSQKEIFHPSEECHRQKWLNSESKNFDVINSYHVFCYLCKKHFYSRSVPTDINSFFQGHINTEYHREFRESQFPHYKEMFTWEEKWKTGRCNVCQMSDLVAFVKDMDCGLKTLLRQHYCVWQFIMQKNSQEFLRKMSLLKKYCQLSIFKKKFIKPLDEGSACLLCCSKIPWSGENVKIHLGSRSHLNRFCWLVWNRHNLSPKDLMNGFNLELVTRWIYHCVLKPPEELQCDYERNRLECFVVSSDTIILDVSASSGHYCPKVIEKLLADQSSDFTQQSRMQYHAETIRKYKQLMEGTNLLSLKVGVKNAKMTYLRKMFSKKLALVKKPPSQFLKEDFICKVCDLHIPAPLAVNHVTEFGHQYHYKKWQELEKSAGDNRFFEPFQKIKNHVICLLCGISAQKFQIFSHLKGTLHEKRFGWYCTLKNEVPISSAIEIKPDLSIVCYLCDSIILKKMHKKEFKINLRVIQDHWPCPQVTKQKEETEKSFKPKEDMERACSACGGSQGAHKCDCPTNSLRFRTVENAVKGIINAYEDSIFERVLGRTRSMIHGMEAAMVTVGKQRQETACECGEPKLHCICARLNGYLAGSELVVEKCDEFETIHLKTEKAEYKKKNFSNAEEEKMQEILIISGLRKSQRKFELVSRLLKFGKIHAIYHQGSSAEAIFVERGVAEKVAASMNLFPSNNPPVTMTVALKKVSEIGSKESNNVRPDHLERRGLVSAESNFPPLPSDLLKLLEEPWSLLEFVANLTAAATAASESVEELEREKLVCATINSAVVNLFPKCRCYPFGSRLSGLMFSNSDLDVFLDCGGTYEGIQNMCPFAERRLVHKVAKALRKKQEVTHLVIVDRARVPIVSFFHKPTGIHCDLSFKNALSVHNTLLIKFLVSLDYQVKFVIIFLKYWVKQNGIHGPPFFSSYAITMMAIFYFQQLNPPMMPTIEELQNAFVGRRLTIGGWDCSFSENSKNLVRRGSDYPLHVILQGFFSYYSNFDYVKFVISPLDGKPLPREAFSFDGQSKLPMCYKRHILNFPLPLENLVCQKLPICVIDPFDLSHVLTKSFTPTGLQTFKHFCQLSAKALKKGVLGLLSSNNVQKDDF